MSFTQDQIDAEGDKALNAAIEAFWHDFYGPDSPHRACITKDGRNLHDEGYCDFHGQDYNEWRG